MTNTLNDLCENKIPKPVIIALDEFQHSRTLVGPQKAEIDDKNRVLWDLIDSGKIHHKVYKFGVWRLFDTVKVMTRLNQSEIVVENGIITKGWERCIFEPEYFRQEEKLFITEDNYATIIDLAGDELGISLHKELKEKLLKYNGDESIAFLQKVIKIASRPVERDFSKALIFVLGNIDEAYPMSSDFAVDISADEYHRQSLKIKIADIKDALKLRFRNEQIARLGNIHIIYPALSVKAYEDIIQKELNNICKKTKNTYGVSLEFDSSIIKLIYNEGVFPTQGVRPVLTTINQLIRNRISGILTTYFEQKYSYTSILVTFYKEHQLKVDYFKNGEISLVKIIDLQKELKRYNINTKDEEQSITAVHESGHAIIAALVLNTFPKHIFSKTIEKDFKGFVFTNFGKDYLSKKEIVKRVALYLGGIAAEEIIFGEENVTSGSAGDITDATEFVMRMLKREGMGTTKLAYKTKSEQNNYFYHQHKQIEKEAKLYIKKGYLLAKETLQKEFRLLLEMANYLSDNTYMETSILKKFIKNFAIQNVHCNTSENDFFYRNFLKTSYKEMITDKKIAIGNPICLNKKLS